MRSFLFMLAIMLSMCSVVYADDGSIPGTDISRPANDIACDKSFDDGDYAKALPLCISSETGYVAIVKKALGESEGRDDAMAMISRQLKYDQAYTDWEIAFCYSQSSDRRGHEYGKKAEVLFHEVHDPDWRMINAVIGRAPDDHDPIDVDKFSASQQQAMLKALSSEEATLDADFVAVMMRVNRIYPDIFTADAARMKSAR